MPCYNNDNCDIKKESKQMPCKGPDDNEYRELANKKQADLTRLLCGVMTILEKEDLLQDAPYAAVVWWENHKKLDAQKAKKV